MKNTPLAALLSLVTLAIGTQAAQAENPIDFTPPDVATPSKVADASGSGAKSSESIAISFDPPVLSQGVGSQGVGKQGSKPVLTTRNQQSTTTATRQPSTANPSTNRPPSTINSSDDIFAGGSNSLVARTVGSAEGTRTVEGHKTSAYHGHTDPGNGVWNLGSFSYQHEAANPEDADEKQLARLQRQDETLKQHADRLGVTEYEADLTVRLNGIDLANQSPMAALAEDGGGYIDRLKQAHEMGLIGSEAVLWARVRSYLDPDTNRWNAPGLGNTVENISHDQERRMDAIARAFEVYQAEVARFAAKPPSQPVPSPQPQDPVDQIVSQDLSQTPKPVEQPTAQPESVADQIIFQNSEVPASQAETPVEFGLDSNPANSDTVSQAEPERSPATDASNAAPVEFETANLQALAR
jgi:hypothetical protein